jgi:zinc/manganese transport system ATP-binding protein
LQHPPIELVNVTAVYEGERIPALHGITLAVAPNELVGVVGPNGAGKTTLLEVINGLLPITTGTVRVLGEPVSPSSHGLRQQIAYLPQDLFFDPSTPFLSKDVVLMSRFAVIGPFRFPGQDDRALVTEAMAAVGIGDLAARPIGRLSGGQQRKVLLARVLAKRPQILLLDEPTTNLDPESKKEISHLVLQIHHELSLATLTVSHEPGPLLDRADRVLTVAAGRLISEAPGNGTVTPTTVHAQCG